MVLTCEVKIEANTIVWKANTNEIISLIEAIEEKYSLNLESAKNSILSSSTRNSPTFTSDFY